MDPTNNPTPTPNPVSPTPEVGDASTSAVPPAVPATPEAMTTNPVSGPVDPSVPEPTAPVDASGPTAPNPALETPSTPEPVIPSMPEASSTPGAEASGLGASNPISEVNNPTVSIPEPTNPVVMPSQGGTGNDAPMGNLGAINNFDASANNFAVSATDPIMMPDAAPKPDPVEEELKAPMKAAEPVPGSIGSAISGPSGDSPAGVPNSQGNSTPNVAFNETGMGGPNAMQPSGKKLGFKGNKTTLITLVAVASVIVVVLIIILIITLNSGGSGSGNSNGGTSSNDSSNSSPNSPTVIDPDDNEKPDNSNNSILSNTLVCSRSMTEAEIARYNDVISGTYNITAEFDTSELLTNITLVESVVYRDENVSNNEPVEMDVHEAAAKDLTVSNGLTYFLDAVGEDGNLDLSLDAIKTNYEVEDFTCN